MEKYKKYKEAFPFKTDEEIIESLGWELSDKVETIHRLLDEIDYLKLELNRSYNRTVIIQKGNTAVNQ
jgi:hypothetical protein